MDTFKFSKESCPYCHSVAEFDFSIHERQFFHCRSCDLIFKGNLQSETDKHLIQYFQHDYFSEYAHDQLSGSRNAIYSHILDLIGKETPVGKLLDVGCGCGFFLKEARNRGWDVAGVDPSEESIAYADKLLGANIARRGTLEDLSQEEVYDVITMINVLDHSLEPWSDVQKAKTILKGGGLIFLRLPNGTVHSTFEKISKQFKSECLVEKYLIFAEYSFTPRFIRRLLSDSGYRNIIINNATLSGGTLFNPLFTKMVGITADALYIISGGKIILSPSLEVMAWRD